MKKRLIDFTLEEMELLQESQKAICVESSGDSSVMCEKCIYNSLCNCEIFDINFSQEFEVPEIKLQLSEDEKIILKNMVKDFKWLARDENGKLYAYEKKPYKKMDDGIWSFMNNNVSGVPFKSLFQFIKCEDNDPYSIEELMKE
ncbi:MAG: hypothetical protein NC182_01750 [Prevotella sp.]|nr:hypothetical protein [Staphylococcus sp.]MCM1349907.1 hypothetical protein [Prevotella sp.]